MATPLKELRLSSGEKRRMSQECIARVAGLSLQAYRKIEAGGDLFLSNAIAIWSALNQERSVRGLQPVRFDEIWLKKK